MHVGHLRNCCVNSHCANDALLIVNDDWRAALAFDCDGVHLGPDDEGFAAVASMRAAFGDRLIGLSCGTVDEARSLTRRMSTTSVSAPSMRPHRKPMPASRSASMGCARSPPRRWNPVAAIGGIGPAQLDEVRATGVAMAAVISAVADAVDPKAAAQALVERWNAVGA